MEERESTLESLKWIRKTIEDIFYTGYILLLRSEVLKTVKMEHRIKIVETRTRNIVIPILKPYTIHKLYINWSR